MVGQNVLLPLYRLIQAEFDNSIENINSRESTPFVETHVGLLHTCSVSPCQSVDDLFLGFARVCVPDFFGYLGLRSSFFFPA